MASGTLHAAAVPREGRYVGYGVADGEGEEREEREGGEFGPRKTYNK